MNLKEYAAKSGITLAKAKTETGLTHWNQTVPEIIEADVEIIEEEVIEDPVEELVEAVVQTITKPVETKSKLGECPVDLADLALSIKIHGEGSPVWAWEGLLSGD